MIKWHVFKFGVLERPHFGIMTGIQSEIIILIDISAFSRKEWKADLIDHVKEAVSFQISRGAITNRKLIRLGLEPYLARVKWAYIFFDSNQTTSEPQAHHVNPAVADMFGQSMKTLTYECWDLFEEELNKEVKSYSGKDENIPVNTRMRNVIRMLQNLKFPYSWPRGLRCSNPDLATSLTTTQNSVEKFIIVFTAVPKVFSCLVHLAAGITACKSSMSVAANCSPADIQICFVDVTFDSVSLQEHGGLGKLPCFWDDVCRHAQRHSNQVLDRKLSLKVSCLKKIMMIHKLMEMRFPWMYDHSLPFGFGLGMKRLRQWEWRIPQEMPQLSQSAIRRGCLSLRKCCSEETYYCGHLL